MGTKGICPELAVVTLNMPPDVRNDGAPFGKHHATGVLQRKPDDLLYYELGKTCGGRLETWSNVETRRREVSCQKCGYQPRSEEKGESPLGDWERLVFGAAQYELLHRMRSTNEHLATQLQYNILCVPRYDNPSLILREYVVSQHPWLKGREWDRCYGTTYMWPVWPDYGLMVCEVAGLHTVEGLVKLFVITRRLMHDMEHVFQSAIDQAAKRAKSASGGFH